MYKAHARHLLAIAFVIYLAAAVIAALFELAGGTIGALLGSLVEIVAAFLLQATLVKAVQDVRDGRVDLSPARPSARPRRTSGRWPGPRSWPESRSPSG